MIGWGEFGVGDLMEGVGMGRVWLVRVAIHTVFEMAGDGRNPWSRGILTGR